MSYKKARKIQKYKNKEINYVNKDKESLNFILLKIIIIFYK